MNPQKTDEFPTHSAGDPREADRVTPCALLTVLIEAIVAVGINVHGEVLIAMRGVSAPPPHGTDASR